MKNKKTSKKFVAIILSVVMIATSIPFMLIGSAAGGDYDPAPYFDEAAREEGARAWVDDDGNVQVAFPSAIAQPTYKGDPLNVEFYILELVDMGPKDTIHTDIVLDTIKVPAMKARTRSNTATFEAANIGTIDLNDRRYSVEITAVDEQNWFSESLYTTVTDVPEAYIDADNVASFVESSTAVREIMTFDSGTDDGHTTGNALLYKGVEAEGGTQNAAGTGDTAALRFIMYNTPSGTQTFDTSYSRQTWDFQGAEEMWVWMDLENVELTGLAFRLKTNEKLWEEWNDDKSTLDNIQREGSIVYSTKGTAAAGYTGEDPYVYVQQEDGTWEKVMLKDDGTLDVGNMVGYIRVPLKFMCSETDSYVDISNQEIACGYDYKSGINNTVQDSDVQSWLQSMTFGKITVDPAGTPISDALLIHRRIYASSSGFLNAGDRHLYMWNADAVTHTKQSYTSSVEYPPIDYSKTGYMLAIPLGSSGTDAANDVKTGEVSTDRAYIANGAVQNRAVGLKAIQDIYTAGFSVEGCSADSLKEDFYLDNIFFYRTDGGAYSENTLDGNLNTGDPLSSYFDEELELAKIIFNEIDKYIDNPDWADYREVHYILDLIDEYKNAYAEKYPDKSTNFLDVAEPGSGTGLAACSATINDVEWSKFWEAYQECLLQGTLATANSEKEEILPLLINTLEKMPKAKDIKSVSNILRLEIVKVWRAYSLLNLGQLKMLGKEEEQEIIDLISLLDNFDDGTGDKFVVGQALADYPYIVFNDFEDKSLGERGWQVENDNNAFTTAISGGTGDLANDWRHLKGITTYSTNGNTNITDKDYYGYTVTDSDKTQEALDNKVLADATYAEITDSGYLNSHGATVRIENTGTASNQDGVFHTITFSRNAKDVNTFEEMMANNAGLDGLGYYASNNKTGNPAFLVSLIFYVDFSEIDNFYFTTNIFTRDADGNQVKARPNMGIGSANENWVYSILDPATGEWRDIHTTSQYCFNSNANPEYDSDLGFNLNNYRGYIKIPLYHVKYYSSIISEPKLDENETYLNNIFAIQFAVGGGSSLYGKSFTIDNVGFTFDNSAYDNAPQTNKTYAEQFNAKSTPAYEFEKYVSGETVYETEIQSQPQVDESGNPVVDGNGNQVYIDVEVQVAYPGIDIYDEATREERVNRALDYYRALPEHQKKMVADTYKVLAEYQEIILGYKTLPDPVLTPEELNEIVASLPEAARNASVNGDYDLIYPGFTKDENNKDAVNYAGYGLDAETAQQIIDYYNNSYAYYSKAEKAQVNFLEFLNAYRAAMRTADSLEKIKADVDAVAPQISTLYTPVYDENGNRISSFVKLSERDTVGTFYTEEYLPISFYAKTSLSNGQLQSAYRNASRVLTYFLKNSDTYSIDGETIEGGIITFQKKMQAVYDNALDKITNKKLFTEAELQEIKDIIEEYNALLPAYYNVQELYDLEQLILGLFPVIDEQIDVDKTDILLSEEVLSDTSTITVDYAQTLDLKSTNNKYYFKVTSQNGALTNTLGDSKDYSLTIGGEEVTVSGMTEAGTPYTKDIESNTYTPTGGEASPLDLAITPHLDSKLTSLKGSVSDVLTVQIFHTKTVTVNDADGNPQEQVVEEKVFEQLITVTYSVGDAYTVTIPAEFPIDWDNLDEHDVSYSVETNMVTTSKINVGVSNEASQTNANTEGTDVMRNGDYELVYNYKNFAVTEFGYSVTGGKPDPAPAVWVTQENWDAAAVGAYRDTLTYTVEYLTNQSVDDGTE